MSWLAHQHQKFLNGDSTAANDEEFRRGLAAWDLMEQRVRELGYTKECGKECGSSTEGCPKDAPVWCAWCVLKAAVKVTNH